LLAAGVAALISGLLANPPSMPGVFELGGGLSPALLCRAALVTNDRAATGR